MIIINLAEKVKPEKNSRARAARSLKLRSRLLCAPVWNQGFEACLPAGRVISELFELSRRRVSVGAVSNTFYRPSDLSGFDIYRDMALFVLK